MSRVAFVVAVSRNGVIGRAGGLPWRISADLKRFKAITMGKPLIMGRKTWESLPKKPLPGRPNIVITRQKNYLAEGAIVVSDIPSALAAAGQVDEVCVIGGGEIFDMFLPQTDRIYLTDVDLEVDGDTFFPMIDPVQWTETAREIYPRGSNDSAGFVLRVLDRNA
jgi:dihydrofolate reductase